MAANDDFFNVHDQNLHSTLRHFLTVKCISRKVNSGLLCNLANKVQTQHCEQILQKKCFAHLGIWCIFMTNDHERDFDKVIGFPLLWIDRMEEDKSSQGKDQVCCSLWIDKQGKLCGQFRYFWLTCESVDEAQHEKDPTSFGKHDCHTMSCFSGNFGETSTSLSLSLSSKKVVWPPKVNFYEENAYFAKLSSNSCWHLHCVADKEE